jgi:phage FluMu gp28-like protein
MSTELVTQQDAIAAFVGFQQEFVAAVYANPVVVVEKSRRTGYSWVAALISVLIAAEETGMDVYYQGYEKTMTREFIGYCGDWGKLLLPVALDFEESLFKNDDNPDKDILSFRVALASGFEINALSGAARGFRGKQGLAIIDEAAYHDNLQEAIDAAMAFLMWGGKVVIISTHLEDTNDFNTLVKDVRAGKLPYKLLRCTLDDAIKDGLVKRIFMKTRQPWSPEAEAQWRADLIARYGEKADRELFCVPDSGEGAYLPAALIEARMREGLPVRRLQKEDAFKLWAEHLRVAEIEHWCEDELKPLLDKLDKDCPHVFGQDFARKRDLSVFWPLAIGKDLVLRTPFLLEMRNIPYEAQKQIVFYIVDRLPRFRAGKFDAGGNGGYLAEVAQQRYGERIEAVMLSEPWYRENMPRWKAAFEDGTIIIPKDSEVLDDHRLVKLVRGVGRVPDERTGEKDKKRHGDSAIAGALAVAASKAEPEEYGYEAVPMRQARTGSYGFFETADDANRAQDDAQRDGHGFIPRLTRRSY